MKTNKDLELSLLVKELHIQQLKHKINVIKSKLEETKESYLKENETLKWVCDYDESKFPIRYYMNEGAEEVIDYVLEELK